MYSSTKNTIKIMAIAAVATVILVGLVATLVTDPVTPMTTLGTEVQTTAEYELLFNDSFTGRIIQRTGLAEDAVVIRNTDGEERRLAGKWIEAVE